jgi:hypothetical protein
LLSMSTSIWSGRSRSLRGAPPLASAERFDMFARMNACYLQKRLCEGDGVKTDKEARLSSVAWAVSHNWDGIFSAPPKSSTSKKIHGRDGPLLTPPAPHSTQLIAFQNRNLVWRMLSVISNGRLIGYLIRRQVWRCKRAVTFRLETEPYQAGRRSCLQIFL